MSRVSELVEKYQTHIALPWLKSLAPQQRVLFLVYEPAEELKLRLLLDSFEASTKAVGHGWKLVDVENAFADWMSQQDYKEAYFENPELFTEDQLEPFVEHVTERIIAAAGSVASDPEAVVAVAGAGAMFGLASVHRIVESAARNVAGRLAVFFPGSCSGGNFRLLDGHDGAGYHATVINA